MENWKQLIYVQELLVCFSSYAQCMWQFDVCSAKWARFDCLAINVDNFFMFELIIVANTFTRFPSQLLSVYKNVCTIYDRFECQNSELSAEETIIWFCDECSRSKIILRNPERKREIELEKNSRHWRNYWVYQLKCKITSRKGEDLKSL